MLMKLLSTLNILFLTLFAVGLQAQTTITDNINVDGLNRSYRLRIPPAGGSSDLLPLVINMHGFSNSASIQENLSGMNAVADTANFYVVYPNGTNLFLFLKGWYMELEGTPVDDVAFLSALIDELVANYNIDASRVFATGYSMGGGMAVSLACAIPDKVQAIAPVAAYVPIGNGALCNPSISVPVIQFHGTSDGVVPYNGSSSLAPSQAVISAFAQNGGCTTSPLLVNLPDIDPSDGSTVSFASVNDCGPLNNDYHFYRINGGGHTWPGSSAGNQDINASAIMWEFFSSEVPAVKLADLSSSNTNSSEGVWPNPITNGQVLNAALNADGNYTIELTDYTGKIVAQQTGNGMTGELATLQIDNLTSGIYFMQIASQSNTEVSKITIQ
jgi:polyhydroxybutyrate depolymerase